MLDVNKDNLLTGRSILETLSQGVRLNNACNENETNYNLVVKSPEDVLQKNPFQSQYSFTL